MRSPTACDRGMLPNRFPDAGETPEYNTVDATLWFFEAIRALIDYTGDYALRREHLYDELKDVIDWHLRGTRYGIRVDDDGLLHAGEPGVQLTWMDAKIGDWVVTPRHGKPVEIQALWYNALRVMEDLARQFDDSATEVFCRALLIARETASTTLLELGRLPVRRREWRRADAAIRPNQIFAVSLRTFDAVRGSRRGCCRRRRTRAVDSGWAAQPVAGRSAVPGAV